MIAIMAGMVVLPACAAFGMEYKGGPGLLFNTMQIVFDQMGGSGSFIGNLMDKSITAQLDAADYLDGGGGGGADVAPI